MCVRLAVVHVIITLLCYVFLFRVLRALQHFGLTFIHTCLALLATIKRISWIWNPCGYPIDHRWIKRDVRGVGGFLGGGSISDGGGMLMVMAKLMKQELASDAEEEGLVPALPGRFTSMRKVPSLSDLSDPESSLGVFFVWNLVEVCVSSKDQRLFDRIVRPNRK
ncbi:hypothetical protein HZH66_012141 [Vespula vulgaris]|uniref:Uncharacterized protein n=1 Tax=Vespula vulgaris TaxID=7454 RepID=A0A834MUL7_VESVU|nr:hypothetical protein HZH66_012141 [Vespula vulgaris]